VEVAENILPVAAHEEVETIHNMTAENKLYFQAEKEAIFLILKQFQNEVNDIRYERLARSANPLALLTAAQPYSDNYYQAPKPQRSNVNDDVVTFALEGLPSTYETISTVIVSREPFPDLKMVRSLLTNHEMRLKSRVQNPLVDATFASPMVLLAKSNTSARRGPSLEKARVLLLPHTLGSTSSVPGVTRSDLDMLQSLLAKFGLNAHNISTPSPPVAYTISVPPGFQSVSA
ncbi:hypothetical protein Tco_1153403, partial [Tanacetum coccineum]